MTGAASGDRVVVVGLACEYPEASSPSALWDNVLAQRRAFRAIPPERLPLEAYGGDRDQADLTYVRQAALLTDYEFDRLGFHVAGSVFRVTDTAHWLALDVAQRALADSGLDGDGLAAERAGVIVGNTLTGDYSRAQGLRLRWPYVARALDGELRGRGWEHDQRAELVDAVERSFKAPFAELNEESLAGGLSNTIAGRIANHFDLGGGCWTVDAACASSLLAVVQACRSLTAGELDVALVGGVDVSIDPFELVGFARVGALADDDMRIYDAHPTGFWPGEGCAFAVLLRERDARKLGLEPYAAIAGWGVSSDGAGGITRPDAAGQLRALRQAYEVAGFGPETVPFVEGHGTGTLVGDRAELAGLERLRSGAGATRPAVLGSIKANIGHTKAAAGIAGLVKATMAVRAGLAPPTTACEEPAKELLGSQVLRVADEPEPMPARQPRRASVSAMGFGGVNTHVVIDGGTVPSGRSLTARERRLARSPQSHELLLIGAPSAARLRERSDRLAEATARMSHSELADLAGRLAESAGAFRHRAAVVARRPEEAAAHLRYLSDRLAADDGAEVRDAERGVFAGVTRGTPRVVALLPGQGSPTYRTPGAFARRFQAVAERYGAALPDGPDEATRVAQPAIVRASAAGLALLEALGVELAGAVGHSLGELVAMGWAGALDADAVETVAAARGAVMDRMDRDGGMAQLGADESRARALPGADEVTVAAHNAPDSVVVSGALAAVSAVVEAARREGIAATPLAVSHAFHSPMMQPAVAPFEEVLADCELRGVSRPVWSTVTGGLLDASDDVAALLARQLTAPVRFAEALQAAAGEADVLVEVGPGATLSGLAAQQTTVPALPLDIAGASLGPLLRACAALHAMGVDLDPGALFGDRALRARDPERPLRVLRSPTEALVPEDGRYPAQAQPAPSAPRAEPARAAEPALAAAAQPAARADGAAAPLAETPAHTVGNERPPSAAEAGEDLLEVVRSHLSDRLELPLDAIGPEQTLLGDLHLSSIAVTELAAKVAAAVGSSAPARLERLATATVADLVATLREQASASDDGEETGPPAGVDPWVRTLAIAWHETEAPHGSPKAWTIVGRPGDPLTRALEAQSPSRPEADVIVCALPDDDEARVPLLLEATRAARARGQARLVLAQTRDGAAAFGRSVRAEDPRVEVGVVTVPDATFAACVAAEAAVSAPYCESRYDRDGRRFQPRLEPYWPAPADDGVDADDVVLITGGARGIAAEVAVDLARTGCSLALLGRTAPDDAEVARTLERARATGARVAYEQADVTDPEQVSRAVERIVDVLGAPTVALHAAGRNVPVPLDRLDEETLRRTCAPKVDGLRHLWRALAASPPRLIAVFSSIIARIGLEGQADYALANELMSLELDRIGSEAPGTRTLALEWSAWSGVGMAARLRRVDELAARGVRSIEPSEGTPLLRRVLADSQAPGTLVLTGRFGSPDTVRPSSTELPMLRFLERRLVEVPGIELVVESDVDADRDPYLADHVPDSVPILPGVVGLEAAAQVASAVTGGRPARITDVAFDRAVTVPGGSRRLRLAALASGPSQARVAVRSDETGFAVDHLTATVHTIDDVREPMADPPQQVPSEPASALAAQEQATAEAESPASWLYDELLFHGPRFRRVRAYRSAHARRCVATIDVRPDERWFSAYLPSQLLLGDPGARDAALHAVQACVPTQRLLPVAIERIELRGPWRSPTVRVTAVERAQEGAEFVYDVEIADDRGRLIESWQGLRLRPAAELPAPSWPSAALAAHAERELERQGLRVRVGLAERTGGGDRQQASDLAIMRAADSDRAPTRDPDGKPRLAGGPQVSATHVGDVAMAVAAAAAVGCDAERVQARPAEVWAGMLGPARTRVAEETAARLGLSHHAAATAVWAAAEAAYKASEAQAADLELRDAAPDGWLAMAAGPLAIRVLATAGEGDVTIAVAVEAPPA